MVNRAVADEIADVVLTDEILTDSEAREVAAFWEAHHDQATDNRDAMTTPADIDTHIDHDDDEGGDTLMVNVSITDPAGTSWSAAGHVTPPIADDDLAALIIRAACGAAAMRSGGVWMALQRKLDEDLA